MFDRPNSRLFRPEYVSRSHAFFERFGSWTIIVGRFVPIVRTVATVMAGVGRMRFSLYALYSAIGGDRLWTDGILLLGHQLGKIKFVRDHKGYIDYLVIVVVVHRPGAGRRPLLAGPAAASASVWPLQACLHVLVARRAGCRRTSRFRSHLCASILSWMAVRCCHTKMPSTTTTTAMMMPADDRGDDRS